MTAPVYVHPSHMPEPWGIDAIGHSRALVDAGNNGTGLGWAINFRVHNALTTDIVRANADRVVACVNACAGVPMETLEQVGEHGLASLIARDGTSWTAPEFPAMTWRAS